MFSLESRSLGAGVLRHCLGTFAYCVLRKLARKEKSDWSLNFAGRKRLCFVALNKSRSFGCNSLEQVIHKGVHDAHSLCWNPNIGVYLLQNTVNVSSVSFLSGSSSLRLWACFSSSLSTLLGGARLPGTCFLWTTCHPWSDKSYDCRSIYKNLEWTDFAISLLFITLDWIENADRKTDRNTNPLFHCNKPLFKHNGYCLDQMSISIRRSV